MDTSDSAVLNRNEAEGRIRDQNIKFNSYFAFDLQPSVSEGVLQAETDNCGMHVKNKWDLGMGPMLLT